ncbi:hypothetical protein [Rugosimonospora africana]|uniref:hypothetical protein n=1 Tax=Rugosimonospora africana TaxID=556532 RepID=UPI0019455F3D|nr:hypothetical protein [Rugosimonospora africana]
MTDAAVADTATAGGAPGTPRRRGWPRRAGFALAAVVACLAVLLAAGWVALVVEDSGTPSAAARGTGQDAEWLGHAWVDGRKSQSDVDRLAASLRGTGIHDLFVHTGPFRDDGTLDPGLRPEARWLIGALHAALPGVRVQAWLGAHPVPGQLDLRSPTTRANILTATGQVLDDGYDGVHYDFEPVDNGDPDLVGLLGAAHRLTRARHAILSLSASLLAPLPGLGSVVAAMPGRKGVWSPGYLRRLAGNVDQVAVMAYDTGLWTASLYGGYVRRLTGLALDAVPAGVALFIGVPAYHDDSLRHHRAAETMPAALRGVRLALGAHPSRRNFGVAVYVDFTATAADWSHYRHDWMGTAG